MTFRSAFQHRDDLLAAALDEFCAEGYEAASLNRILGRSGVSKGQLYHHFDGKSGLYLGLVEWMIDQKAAWLADHPVAAGGDLFDLLAAQVRASVGFAAAHPDVDRLSRSLLAERGRPIYAAVVDRIGFEPDGMVGALVEHAVDAGQLRSDAPLALLQRAITTWINHLPELLAVADPAELERDLDTAIDLLRRGVGSPR